MAKLRRALVLACGLTLTSGCGHILGNTTADISDVFVMPNVLERGDVDIGCAAGAALGPMIGSFGQSSKKALRASVMTVLSSAMCVEEDVREAQLAQARALHRGDTAGAKDAIAVEKRAHLLAARRYLLTWERLKESFGLPEGGESCPKLRKPSEQLTYLLGLSAGTLAVIHDTAADQRAGVSMRIPGEVVRASACVDDADWWGVPSSLRAAVWAVLPGAPEDQDPWLIFREASQRGEAAGVRMADAFHVTAAATRGDAEELRATIKAHVAREANAPIAGPYAMLDAYARAMVQHESDLIWTSSTGHRTPYNELGSFPDEQSATETPDGFDDLFDGLDD